MIKVIKFVSIGEIRKGETKKGQAYQAIAARAAIVGTDEEVIVEIFEMDGEFGKVKGLASLDKTKEYKAVLAINSTEHNGRFYTKISIIKFLPLEEGDKKKFNGKDWLVGKIENVSVVHLNEGLILNTLITTATGKSIEVPIFADSEEKYKLDEWLLVQVSFDVDEYEGKEYLKIKSSARKLVSEIFSSTKKTPASTPAAQPAAENEQGDNEDDLPF